MQNDQAKNIFVAIVSGQDLHQATEVVTLSAKQEESKQPMGLRSTIRLSIKGSTLLLTRTSADGLFVIESNFELEELAEPCPEFSFEIEAMILKNIARTLSDEMLRVSYDISEKTLWIRQKPETNLEICLGTKDSEAFSGDLNACGESVRIAQSDLKSVLDTASISRPYKGEKRTYHNDVVIYEGLVISVNNRCFTICPLASDLQSSLVFPVKWLQLIRHAVSHMQDEIEVLRSEGRVFFRSASCSCSWVEAKSWVSPAWLKGIEKTIKNHHPIPSQILASTLRLCALASDEVKLAAKASGDKVELIFEARAEGKSCRSRMSLDRSATGLNELSGSLTFRIAEMLWFLSLASDSEVDVSVGDRFITLGRHSTTGRLSTTHVGTSINSKLYAETQNVGCV